PASPRALSMRLAKALRGRRKRAEPDAAGGGIAIAPEGDREPVGADLDVAAIDDVGLDEARSGRARGVDDLQIGERREHAGTGAVVGEDDPASARGERDVDAGHGLGCGAARRVKVELSALFADVR